MYTINEMTSMSKETVDIFVKKEDKENENLIIDLLEKNVSDINISHISIEYDIIHDEGFPIIVSYDEKDINAFVLKLLKENTKSIITSDEAMEDIDLSTFIPTYNNYNFVYSNF